MSSNKDVEKALLMDCEKLGTNKVCKVIKEKCYRLNSKTACEYYKSYWKPCFSPKMIQGLAQDDKRVMDDLRKMFLSNWKKACSKKKGGKTGDKSIIAGPLESVITSFLRNEFREGVEVEKGKIEEISWDVVIKKKKGGSPECLISIKTYIGPGQIRETWASAYLAKRHDRKIKIYMVGIRPADARKPDNNAKRMNDYLNKFPRKGIDKIFYLTTKPYFSSLVKELRGKFTLSRKSS